MGVEAVGAIIVTRNCPVGSVGESGRCQAGGTTSLVYDEAFALDIRDPRGP